MQDTRREFLKMGTLGLLGLGVQSVRGASAEMPVADLEALSDRVEFMKRSEWTADDPCPSRLHHATRFMRITVHHAGAKINCHSEGNSVIYDLQGVLAGHAERKYGDIGYHFVVDYVGRVWEGRSLKYEGAHVLGENLRNIGIMFLGNFEMQKPSEEQLHALAELTGFLMEQYGIRKERVYGHRDLGHSLCPGRHLYPHVVKLRT